MAWEQLLAIYASAAQSYTDERDNPPVACPQDATPLRKGPEGILYCPFDGYQWPRDGRLI